MKVQAFIFLFVITTLVSSKRCKDKLNSTTSNSQKTVKNKDNGKTLDITSGIKIEMAEALDSVDIFAYIKNESKPVVMP